MKAVAYTHSLPISDPLALKDLVMVDPKLERSHDLLVKVAAVAVNPVDTKLRRNRRPAPGAPGILGWDTVGTVLAANNEAQGFQIGDRVFYAGAIDRAGCNSELHVVDSRIVAHAPASLTNAQAAALPLTSLTAWELLFDRLGVPYGGGEGQSLLVIGGAGGAGSTLIQIARQLTQLKVIATTSRPESVRWVSDLGAHGVIDHTRPFMPQLRSLGLGEISIAASLTHSPLHLDDIVAALAPQGRLAMIDDFESLDIMKLKSKSISLHWELMFTRSLYGTVDISRQGQILREIARLADSGRIRTTLAENFGPINAANLKRAHALIESGRAIGKLVLEGF